MALGNEAARYRGEMANLLEKSVATTRELERWLDVKGGVREMMAQGEEPQGGRQSDDTRGRQRLV